MHPYIAIVSISSDQRTAQNTIPVVIEKLNNKNNVAFNVQWYLCISSIGEKVKSYLIYRF